MNPETHWTVAYVIVLTNLEKKARGEVTESEKQDR